MTSSPGPIPSASSTSTSASVPLATPIVCRTPRYAAASSWKAAYSGPRMKAPDSRTLRKRSSSSGISGAYCALTSTSGTFGMAIQSRGPHPADDQVDGEQHDDRHDRVVDVAQVAVRVRVARSQRPARAREAETEDRAARGG